MKTPSTKSFLCNRGAVALNNLGVSLLQKGLFKSSFLAFKDAIKLLKAHDNDEVVLGMTISERIGHFTTNLLRSATDDFERQLQIQEYVYTPGQQALVLGERSSASGEYSYPVIRIELDDFGDDPDHLGIEMEAIAVLHNMAIASANVFPSVCEAGEAESNSIRLLLLALSLIETLLSNATVGEDSFDESSTCLSNYVTDCLQFENIILQTIHPLLQELGRQAEADGYARRLRSVSQFLAEREADSWPLNDISSLACCARAA